MDDALRNEIGSLRKLTTRGLKDRYRELFGEPSPSSNRDHLFRRVAWRLQAKAEGDLSDRALRRAKQLANDSDLRLRAPSGFWQEFERTEAAKPVTATRDPRLPPIGTILRRSYRGQGIEVTVRADGFDYQGQTYAALSSIAFAVTGTRWNGFAFFGLQQGRERA
jgi:Protein of unknown function (DUF2924)